MVVLTGDQGRDGGHTAHAHTSLHPVLAGHGLQFHAHYRVHDGSPAAPRHRQALGPTQLIVSGVRAPDVRYTRSLARVKH